MSGYIPDAGIPAVGSHALSLSYPVSSLAHDMIRPDSPPEHPVCSDKSSDQDKHADIPGGGAYEVIEHPAAGGHVGSGQRGGRRRAGAAGLPGDMGVDGGSSEHDVRDHRPHLPGKMHRVHH